jgi:hypothetical protein
VVVKVMVVAVVVMAVVVVAVVVVARMLPAHCFSVLFLYLRDVHPLSVRPFNALDIPLGVP